VTARDNRGNERTGAGVMARLFYRRCNVARVFARKPRRDRIRRGAGSETREVSGPRAQNDQIRWKGAWARGCVSLNRRRDCDPGFGGSIARVLNCMRGTAGDADGPRVGAFRSDDGIQRSGRFGHGSSNHALKVRHGAGGRHPRRGAPHMRSGRRRHEVQLAASREVVASREACDTRNAPDIVTAEVGDGLTALPLVFPAGRANGRRRT
jgi:hypothetical protein